MADPTSRNLDPQSLAFTNQLQRGALVVLPSTTRDTKGKTTKSDPQVLRFQYNPETVTRTRTGGWDARKNNKVGPPVPAKGAPSASQTSEKNNFRGGGMFAKAETVAMKLVFDATEFLLRDSSPDKELGILPELAVLELIALGEAPKDDGKKDPKDDAKLNPIHPKELLLVLGPRYFPVIITQMTISEKRFNYALVPIRAEIDLQMQVLEATEVDGDPAIRGAYNKLVGDRLDNAKKAAVNAKAGNLDTLDGVQQAVASALRPRGA